MKNNLITLGIFIIFVFFACEKIEDIPCTSFPCGSDNPDNYNYNRVAFDPEFRIGTWINVRASASSPDTIIFHNDSIWSNFYFNESSNQIEGVFSKVFQFDGLYLEFYDGYDGNPLPNSIRKQTYYSDSTGVFSILNQQGLNDFQLWDHYIKIE